MPIHAEAFGDFAMFLTQSFPVDVNLNIGPRNRQVIDFSDYNYPLNILLVFMNSASSSRVNYQGFDIPYTSCINEVVMRIPNEDLHKSLQLVVIFYETPSFKGSNVTDVLIPLLIKNVSFTKYHTNYPHDGYIAMLQVMKLTRKLSHEVLLDSVAWCANNLLSIGQYLAVNLFSPFHAQAMVEEDATRAGGLYLKIKNTLMHHNERLIGELSQHKSFACLMNF